MAAPARSRSELDPRAALASLLAHGLAFGAVAAAAAYVPARTPASEPIAIFVEIATASGIVPPAAESEPRSAAPEPAVAEVPAPATPAVAESDLALAKAVERTEPRPIARRRPARPAPIEARPSLAEPTPAEETAAVASVPPSTPAPATAGLEHRTEPDTAPIPVTTEARFRSPPAAPDYPPRARQMGLEGTTILRALVGETGDTLELVVWRGSGLRALDDAALAAARNWRFEAAKRGDRTMAAWVEIPVRFVLN